MRVSKTALIIIGVLTAAVLLIVALGWPFVFVINDIVRSASQQRSLQSRSDYPQIAAASVSLARGVTNESVIWPTNPIVPQLLRSLSPRYISASSNRVTLEFHGGFDHYGYDVRQSETNERLWTIYYYTEKSEKSLATTTAE